MTPLIDNSTLSPRLHPIAGALFKTAESRHFTDEELAEILKVYPSKAPELNAAREIRDKDVAVINRVVKEIFAQYPYDKHHELASAKCPRDVRYVVAYASHSMIAGEPRWFEDKLLIWLKTILQAFNFPGRNPAATAALFVDEELENKLKKLPVKMQSTFHTYYRLKQEMGKVLTPESFALIAPYLDLATNVLTEDY